MLKLGSVVLFVILVVQKTDAQFDINGCSGLLPLLQYGIFFANDTGPIYPVGTVFTYSCLDGFQLSGASNEVTCLENETFSELSASCELAPFLSECRGLNDKGEDTSVLYDECTSFCCGGQSVDNSTNFQCCGSELYGSSYNPRIQDCCLWWTGHGKGHPKPTNRDYRRGVGCCGAERIYWNEQNCCYGHPDPPQIFKRKNEICCNAHNVSVVGSTYNSKCCGESASYMSRTQSCPCSDGQVLNTPESESDCCESPEGFKTPYLKQTQFCCNGDIGEITNQFCCGDQIIGTIGENVCCTDKLFSVDPPNANLTGCCNGEGYDPRFYICCDDIIIEIEQDANQCCGVIPYDISKSICCDQTIHSITMEGDTCCANSAFFPDKGHFCCNGAVFTEDIGGDSCCGNGFDVQYYFKDEHICCDGEVNFRTSGDSCCGTQPFSSKTSICCDGQIFDNEDGKKTTCCNGIGYDPTEQFCCGNGPFGPFRTPACCNGEGYDRQGGTVCCGTKLFKGYQWPSCCIDEGYDARTNSCCDGIIRPNPNNSPRTQCCADLPFDTRSDLCCDGEIFPIPEGVPRRRAECCDIVGVYNTRTQLCCVDTIYDKTDRFTSKCCGFEMYNTTEQICCEPNQSDYSGLQGLDLFFDNLFFQEPLLENFVYGKDSTECCGNIIFNNKENACCGENLYPTDFETSGCCGGVVFDRTLFICCEDQLLPIGNVVPWEKAECCGRRCIYRGKMSCCNDRTYISNTFTQMDCESYVEP